MLDYAGRIERYGYGIIGVLCAIVSLAVASGVHAADIKQSKRVLLISTGTRFSPGFALVDKVVLEELGKIEAGKVEVHGENLDIVRFSTERFARIFTEYLTEKYADQPPDLIILVYVGKLGIAGKLLQQLFPGTPVVVAGHTEEEILPSHLGSLVSGIAQRVDARGSLELILRLQPETRRIVVISGTAEVDRHVLNRVKEAARSLAGRVEFDFWDNRTANGLRQAIATLPPRTAILFTRMFRDAAGEAMISGQAGQWIGQWANVPVYIMTDTSLGTGAVGGAIASVEAFGKRAGELARLILTGAAPASLPFEIRTDSVPIFDWRALKRWGIPESRLPPASVVRFKPLSMWEQNRWYIIGALGIIGIQAAIITGLLKQRRRLRRTETELSESRQFMDLATDAGGIGLWVRDLVGERFWGNPRLRSLFGFGEADPLGIDEIFARIHPDDRERVRALVQREQEDDPQFDVEFRTAEREGAPNRWLAARGRVVRGPHGKPLRRMGTVIDISERKEAEDALQKERRFLRQVIDINPNFIFAKDRAGRFTLANRAVADAYGTTVENLMGKTDADFNASAEEVEFFHQMDLEVMATLQERFILEERITDARGKVRWLQTVKRPIVGTDGAANQVLGTSTDITQRKVAELELRQQREDLAHLTRVSNMGELAASLAHELNQPLTAILSNSQAAQRFLSNKPSAIEEVREILHDIVEDTNRASEVIRRLRALSRKQAVAFDRVDLPGTIREITMLLHSDAVLRNVRVSLEADSDLPPVRGDKIQLQQVLLNLMLNAFDAMKECPEENREVLLRAGSNGTDTVEVSVADHGPGLATDELDRLFQPFFTTKRDGLGMGLSICRSIIENHRGRLWAENNRDGGATFFFTVPVDRDAAE